MKTITDVIISLGFAITRYRDVQTEFIGAYTNNGLLVFETKTGIKVQTSMPFIIETRAEEVE